MTNQKPLRPFPSRPAQTKRYFYTLCEAITAKNARLFGEGVWCSEVSSTWGGVPMHFFWTESE